MERRGVVERQRRLKRGRRADAEKRGYSKGRGREGWRLPGCVEFLRLKRDFQNNKLRGKWKGKALLEGARGWRTTLASTIREGFRGWLAGLSAVERIDIRLIMSQRDT